MNSNFPRECPEEQALLDYLAGELGPEAGHRIGQHLKTCTDCALRADQLSEDFADVGRAMEVELPLPPLRLAAARARLRERQEAYEASRAARVRPVPVGGTWTRIAFVAAAVVVLIGGAAALYFLRHEPALTAEQVLDRAKESIPADGMRPSMARYEVEIAQLEPVSATRKHQLVIWADPNSGGYTSRLEDPDGSLRHAVWRRGPDGPAVTYDRAAGEALIPVDRSARDRQPTLLASMGTDISCDLLASGFARWLEARRWSPLRVSRDFALLASDDATVRLERSGDVVLVVAQKQEGGLHAEVTLALDAGSYEPYWLEIHFRSPQGESTFKLIQNEVRLIAASHLDASVFEARLPSSGAVRARLGAVPRPQPEPASDAPGPQVVEARLRHALHAAGACLREPVEVVHGPDGMLALRGIVGTTAMKEAILEALRRSDVLDSVSVEIRTREEAAGDARDRFDLDGIAFGPPGVEPARSRARIDSVQGLALTVDLTDYFRSGHSGRPADSVGNDLNKFAEGAVERAEDLLRRAWALRRLAERYGHGNQEAISPEAADLVRDMCQDHLEGIGTSARASADWTLPALGAIANSRGVRETVPEPTSRTARPARAWPDSFLSLFEAANSIHRDTLALLTVRLDLTEAPASAVGRSDSTGTEDVDRTLRRLLENSRAFGAEVSQTADAFAAGTQPGPAAPLVQGARR